MLRPEQMSKVSVTGSKSVMDEVIETMHDLHLVHITDYDGTWEGFSPGDSLEGADEVSGDLVTVRAIESILDVTEEDAGPTAGIDLSDAGETLEEIRTEVNDLDDRRDDLRSRQREIEEQLDQMSVFADLGLDLDLLWGYDSLTVRVGEGDDDAIDDALAQSKDIDAFEVFSGGSSVAVFAREQADGALEDAMVGVSFTAYDVPEVTGDPASNVADLENEHEQIQTKLERTENELQETKLEHAGFLLALEEQLTIDAEKYEAPLRFATTERSFIVEGWVPTEKYEEFAVRLEESVGERIELSEIKRAKYTAHGNHHTEEVEDEQETEVSAEPDEGQAVTDGGHAADDLVTVDDEPPVVQDNPKVINPFEVLVRAVNRPKYSEFDPTVTIFLTFPLFFGFMIGDIGYGVIYMILGWFMYKKAGSETVSNVGAVIVWMGLVTAIFGVLYGEILGLHFLDWFGIHPLIEKGISDRGWSITWLIVAVLAGWLHLNIGYIFAFVEEFQLHGFKPAMVEVGSWLLLLNGLWIFIFSTLSAGAKPDFLIGPPEDMLLNNGPLGFGFTGLPEPVGWFGVALLLLGVLLILSGPWYEIFEAVAPLSHTLSYTRLTAVLLGKAGMALAVNLLYFGAYQDEEGFHFIHASTPAHKLEEGKDVVFNGIANMGTEISLGPATLGLEGMLLGLPVYLIGHAVVLAVGGTAAIQAIRLEYFEFFEKFYEGGGKNYKPFGHRRKHTRDN